MERFPPEILEKIVDNLDDKSTARFSSVCHYFRTVSNADKIWKKRCQKTWLLDKVVDNENQWRNEYDEMAKKFGRYSSIYCNIKRIWNKIYDVLNKRLPGVDFGFLPGISDQQLDTFEQKFRCILPEDVRCSYRICGGQKLNSSALFGQGYILVPLGFKEFYLNANFHLQLATPTTFDHLSDLSNIPTSTTVITNHSQRQNKITTTSSSKLINNDHNVETSFNTTANHRNNDKQMAACLMPLIINPVTIRSADLNGTDATLYVCVKNIHSHPSQSYNQKNEQQTTSSRSNWPPLSLANRLPNFGQLVLIAGCHYAFSVPLVVEHESFLEFMDDFVSDLDRYPIHGSNILRYKFNSEKRTGPFLVKTRTCLWRHYLTDRRYNFSYYITMEMDSEADPNLSCQLETRHWVIVDDRGCEERVDGPGVVGEFPIMRPGALHFWISGTRFETPKGSMRGHFKMRNLKNGQQTTIECPQFNMETKRRFLPDHFRIVPHSGC